MRWHDLKVILLITAATALFFWPVWLAGYRFPRGGGDLWGQLYPVWAYVGEWVRRGSFPLWHTRLMAGDPIIAESQYGLLNPLNWSLFLVSPIPDWMVLARGMLSLWLAGVGLYLYLRHSPVWGLRTSSALVGAFAYMFANPFIAHLGHPQFNDTMAWLPWVLLGLEYAARVRRAIPLAGLALGLLLLAGHGQAALYALVLVAGYGVWLVGRGGSRHAFHRLGRLVLVALLAACIAAPGLLPSIERLPYTDRAAVPPASGEYEFQLGMWIDFITPWFHGRGVKRFWGPWDRVETGYVSVVALALAFLGMVRDGAHPRTWFLVSAGMIATLFALGYQGPLYPLVDHLPFFDATWKTGRAIYILSFVLAMGAAVGAEALYRVRNIGIYLWSAGVGLFAIFLWIVAPNWSAAAPTADHYTRALVGLRFAAVVLLATAVWGYVARQGRRRAATGLLMLLLVELTATSAFADVDPPQNHADPHAAAIDYLRADPGWFRVDVDGKARGLWSPAAVVAAGFEVPQGMGNPMEIVAYTQFYWAIPYKGAPAYQVLGAKYIVTPKDALPGGEGIWPVFTQDPLIDIHLNTNALTRVWLVYQTHPVTTLEEAYGLIFSSDFDPVRVATVKGDLALEGTGRGTLEVLAYRPNRVTLIANTDQPALLVLSDLLYPGWQAYVDREPVKLYSTNGLFRGVFVPPGEHEITMRFFPTSFRLGLGLLGMALLMVGFPCIIWHYLDFEQDEIG